MEAVSGDASKLTLKDNTGNRIQLINNIRQELRSAIDKLVSECDTLTSKYEIIGTLERVYDGLDLIKASFKEEGNVSWDHVMAFNWQLILPIKSYRHASKSLRRGILLFYCHFSQLKDKVTLKSPKNDVSSTKVG